MSFLARAYSRSPTARAAANWTGITSSASSFWTLGIRRTSRVAATTSTALARIWGSGSARLSKMICRAWACMSPTAAAGGTTGEESWGTERDCAVCSQPKASSTAKVSVAASKSQPIRPIRDLIQAKIRNPNIEPREQARIQRPKTQISKRPNAVAATRRFRHLDFGLRVCLGFRVSDFVLLGTCRATTPSCAVLSLVAIGLRAARRRSRRRAPRSRWRTTRHAGCRSSPVHLSAICR